jgi:DNA-binding transcriptional LysR family regulator
MSSRQQRDDRIMQRLRLRDLRVFSAVAEFGSMGKAAARLAVSQPAVSKAIAAMEHTLGVPLLDRTPQGVEPTIYGRALLKWSNAFLDDLRQGVREIEYLADPTAGEVRIGTSEPLAGGLVAAVIHRLARQYPRLGFDVLPVRAPPLQYHDLRERTVDLVLGRMANAAAADDDLNVEVLFEDPLFVVAGSASKWARRRRIKAAELVNEAWCLPAHEGLVRSHVMEAFRARGLDIPRQTVGSTSIQLISALLVTGHFLAVLFGSTLRFGGKHLDLKTLPVDLSIRPAPVVIVTLKGRMLSPVAELFIACTREIARALAQKGS